MCRLETARLDRGEETFRLMTTLQQLLERFGAVLAPEFRADVIPFFTKIFPELDNAWCACSWTAERSAWSSDICFMGVHLSHAS